MDLIMTVTVKNKNKHPTNEGINKTILLSLMQLII